MGIRPCRVWNPLDRGISHPARRSDRPATGQGHTENIYTCILVVGSTLLLVSAVITDLGLSFFSGVLYGLNYIV